LLRLRDHGAKPHLRERAAAVLKLADGATIQQVAQAGLLRPRARSTVAQWLNRYRAEGLAGLTVRPGRGRKPAFSPSRTGPDDGPHHAAPSPRP
jgi:transposase